MAGLVGHQALVGHQQVLTRGEDRGLQQNKGLLDNLKALPFTHIRSNENKTVSEQNSTLKNSTSMKKLYLCRMAISKEVAGAAFPSFLNVDLKGLVAPCCALDYCKRMIRNKSLLLTHLLKKCTSLRVKTASKPSHHFLTVYQECDQHYPIVWAPSRNRLQPRPLATYSVINRRLQNTTLASERSKPYTHLTGGRAALLLLLGGLLLLISLNVDKGKGKKTSGNIMERLQ